MKTTTTHRRQLLISLGLTDKEALVYDLLFQAGTISAAELEKQS